MAIGDNGLVIIDIQDPTDPIFAGSYDTEGYAQGVALSSDGRFAFVADWYYGLVIINIQDPTGFNFAGSYKTKDARGVTLSPDGRYAFVADGDNGILIFLVTKASTQQGNLILCPGGPSSDKNPLWAPSQNLANLAYFTFLNQNYYQYFTYYLTPDPSQDIYGNGTYDSLVVDDFTNYYYQYINYNLFPNLFLDIYEDSTYDSLVVDDFTPTKEDFHNVLTNWAYNRLNTGPLYLCLTGTGTENTYQISPPKHILKASDFTVLFEDQFTDNRSNWEEIDNDDAILKLKDGKYIFKSKTQNGYSSGKYIHITQEDDFSIEATIKKIGGGNNGVGYGIYWGNEDVLYFFGISGFGYYSLQKYVNDKWITIID